MTQNVPLDKGNTAIEPFFDAIQELLSGAAPHFKIEAEGSGPYATLRIRGGSGDDQSSIAVDGRYRFRTTDVTATASGAAATYDLYVTAGDNDFTGPPTDLDAPTDYTFGFQVRAVGSPPTGVSLYRKVGQIDFDGTNITGIRMFTGDRQDDAPIRPTAPVPTITPLRVRGAATQSAPLLTLEGSGGAARFQVDPNGHLLLGLIIDHSDGLVISADGGKDTLSLSNTAANVGITLGGDTNLYRAAADSLKTDDALTVGGALYPGNGSMSVGNVGPSSQAGLLLGGDTNLYRSAADTLKTDDALVVIGSLTSGALSATNGAFSGTLGVTGASTLGAVNASGAVVLSAAGTALTVNNNVTISGTSLHSGAATFAAGGTALTVNNNATITGALTMGGNINMTNDSVTGLSAPSAPGHSMRYPIAEAGWSDLFDYAASSGSGLTLTTSEQDVPGCSFTAGVTGTYRIVAVFAFSVINTVGGAETFARGVLNINNVTQGGFAYLSQGVGNGDRASGTVVRVWQKTVTAGQVVKLRAYHNGNGTATCWNADTTLDAQLI